MTLSVRRGTPADAPIIVAFNLCMALETEGKALDPARVGPGVAAALADPGRALYFLAEEDGTVQGQLMITFEWSDWRNGWFWWVQSVYVRPEARRRGVFRALFEHIVAEARKDATVIGIRLYVERDNETAQQTYLRLGLDRTGYLLMERYPLDQVR
jgi:GNAT superfamily N-acetyltransferase